MDVATLLGSYAFPVVACIGMGWFIKYIMDNHQKETEKFTTMMLAYKDEFKDAINNNTRAMEKLTNSIIFEKKGGKKDEIE